MDLNILRDVIKKFVGGTYDEFLKYFYSYFDSKINSEKSQKVKNKYIKIRNSMLFYIVANKQQIMAELRNKR
jgi:hypothetical protein